MSDLAAGGSGPEIDAVAVATAEAPASRGGEPVGARADWLRRLSELDQRDSVVSGLFRAVDRLEEMGFRFIPEHNGGRRETDQHVPRLEDPEEHFRQEMHIDLPWVQGELTVTFTPLASRRGSSTDFGP